MTGRDLKILRLLHGFDTQEEFATYLGVSVRTVGMDEKRKEISAKRINFYVKKGLNVNGFIESRKEYRSLWGLHFRS